jgi:hypothetical protein
MNKQPQYFWSEDTGTAFATIFYKNYTFTGEACCHPDDKDMMSKLTGQTIAEYRATIKYLRFIRDCELQPQLKALKQLYYSMKHSKYFNPKSYEAKMLYRQINILKDDLKENKYLIDFTKKELEAYLTTKERDHKQLRDFLKKKELAEDNQ